ncbi:MAG: hypothetical protein WC693_05005 [Patescibacteria group bacterium]
MRRLHWPRFAVFLMVIATFAIMTAAANGIASATAPRPIDELNSASVIYRAYAQSDGTIVNTETTAVDVENADDAYIDNGATAILWWSHAAMPTTTLNQRGASISTMAMIGGTDQSSSPTGMRDSVGIHFTAVTSDGIARYNAKKMAQVAEKKIVKTTNTSDGVIRV